jgi:hypothetical protein
MKLVALALAGCVIALLLLLPTFVPKPEPPGAIDQVRLQPPVDRAGRATDVVDAAARTRPRPRPGPADGGPRAIRRARSPKAPPGARPISRAVRTQRENGGPRGRSPVADPLTPRSPDLPAPRSKPAPPPRNTPALGGPPSPGDSGPQGRPTPVSSEPADAPDPPDPPEAPDPPEEEAAAAGTGPLDQSDEPEIPADATEDEMP